MLRAVLFFEIFAIEVIGRLIVTIHFEMGPEAEGANAS